MTAMNVLFLAPPETPGQEYHDDRPDTAPPSSAKRSSTTSAMSRLTKAARADMARLGLNETEVSAAMSDATDVRVDDRGRTRFTRAGLTVVAAADGAIIAVNRGQRR